jgi:hypothetical protein
MVAVREAKNAKKRGSDPTFLACKCVSQPYRRQPNGSLRLTAVTGFPSSHRSPQSPETPTWNYLVGRNVG